MIFNLESIFFTSNNVFYPASLTLNYNYNFGIFITFFLISLSYLSINKFICSISIISFILLSLPFLIISILVLNYPLFSIILMILVSIPTFLVGFNLEIFSGFVERKFMVLKKFLILISENGILNIFGYFFLFFFAVSKLRFYITMAIIFSLNIGYIFASRYYFLISKIGMDFNFSFSPILTINLLIFGLAAIYFRLLLSISYNLILVTLSIDKNLLSQDLLYCVGEGVDPSSSNKVFDPSPSSPSSSGGGKKYNFINVNYSRSYYRQNYANSAKNFSFFKYAGLVVALVSVSIGGVAAKAAMDTVEINRDQVRAQEVNNFEMTRQNDLEELSQGLMTKEEYLKKYPKK